jgi:hypothetical protein
VQPVQCAAATMANMASVAIESLYATARAPGKWSPSQIVEHVARMFEEAANVAAGRPSKFPTLPAILHPVVRIFFRRSLKKAAFPKAKANKALDPQVVQRPKASPRARQSSGHGPVQSGHPAHGGARAAAETRSRREGPRHGGPHRRPPDRAGGELPAAGRQPREFPD